PRDLITRHWHQVVRGPVDTSRDEGGSPVFDIGAELRPSTVLEPEIVDPRCCGAGGAVENEAKPSICFLDATNGEIEVARRERCGEFSSDTPTQRSCSGAKQPCGTGEARCCESSVRHFCPRPR